MKNLFGEVEKATIKAARFSECRKHRLWLCRVWDETKPLVMFIGLNPSTANETEDDHTMRRVQKMAKNWGYGGVYMTNLFTYISTDPKKLDMVLGNHQTSNEILLWVAGQCEKIIFSWGNFKVFGRDNEVKKLFPNAWALHLNLNGSPQHPLFVKSDVTPIKY